MTINEQIVAQYTTYEPLEKDELNRLIRAAKNGSKEAEERLVMHNLRLVLRQVFRRFGRIDYDKNDLISIGKIGLIKAINTYDAEKNFRFSSYAVKCIDNEILIFLRTIKDYQIIDSLDDVVFYGKDGSEKRLVDTLIDDSVNFVEELERIETYRIIRGLIAELPDRDKEIIMLRFGFYDEHIYTQKEIADELNIAQSYVCGLITKIVKKLGSELEEQGVIELHERPRVTKNNKKIFQKELVLK